MTRREFIRAVIAVPVSAAALPLVPAYPIFAALPVGRMVDRKTGISMRFVQQYNAFADRLPRELYVTYHDNCGCPWCRSARAMRP